MADQIPQPTDEKCADPIPETVDEALAIWDSGEAVFSVEMGGMGPGYEMAIQGLAFELMREMKSFAKWDDPELCMELARELDETVVHALSDKPWAGFSGAQVAAAKSLAACVCRRGYRVALRDDAVKDRLILVSKKDLRSA